MEAGNKNAPQEDAPIVRNPTNCTAPIKKDKIPCSPFVNSMGYFSEIELQRITRPVPTESTRSPWIVKHLCARLEGSVENFYTHLLEHEATIVRKLNCPNIAGALVLEELGLYVRQLAMEYCTCTLGQMLSERYSDNLGPLEAIKATKVALATLTALDYLHTKAQMMHGDVKSFNILVDDEFRTIKLCGFGAMSRALTASGSLVKANESTNPDEIGLWSAPEILEKPAYISAKSDMFSYGLVLFEMLTCMPPHTFPGIKDGMILAPQQLKRNDLNTPVEIDDEDDDKTPPEELSVNDSDVSDDFKDEEDDEADMPLYESYQRKRKTSKPLIPIIVAKQMKFEGVIINLVDEEDLPNDDLLAKGGITLEKDSIGKENQPIESDNNPLGKDSEAIAEEVPPVVKEEDPVCLENNAQKENEPVGTEANVGEKEKMDDEETPVPSEAVESTDEQQALVEKKETSQTTPVDIRTEPVQDTTKVASSSDPTPNAPDEHVAVKPEGTGNSEKPTQPPPMKRVVESFDVVTVSDSSDEECLTPMKSCEVDNSESGPNDYDTFEEYSMGGDDEEVELEEEEAYGMNEPTYNGTDEGTDSDDDGNYLNYACLGTRPPLPADIVFGKEYDKLLDMFFVCTINNAASRPSAAQILQAYEANKDVLP